MDRKDFIKKSWKSTVAAALIPSFIKSDKKEGTVHPLTGQIGFNHIPTKELKKMNTVIHKSNSRGHANHGWLDSHHSFSFANYYNPERMNFGVLRVLNDDVVAPGRGFSTHAHDNMEIISIPLEGDLEHKDNMGNATIIKQGDIQVMSAGTGVYHSEYNHNKDKDVKFLQIWIFPNKRNVTPRYDQISIKDLEVPNKFYQVLSPTETDQGVWIHQDVWFHMGNFDENTSTSYQVKKAGNGLYAFILEGAVEIEGEKLESRDGIGIWDTKEINLKANKSSKVLLMEVPMNL